MPRAVVWQKAPLLFFPPSGKIFFWCQGFEIALGFLFVFFIVNPSPDLSLQPGWAHLVGSWNKTAGTKQVGWQSAEWQKSQEFRVERTTAAGTVVGWVELLRVWQVASGLCSCRVLGGQEHKDGEGNRWVGGVGGSSFFTEVWGWEGPMWYYDLIFCFSGKSAGFWCESRLLWMSWERSHFLSKWLHLTILLPF